MQYEIELYCPHCGDKELIDPDWPEDIMIHKCDECGKKHGYQAKIKYKVTYYVEWKK
jgi:uncharacterized Zn finger protein